MPKHQVGDPVRFVPFAFCNSQTQGLPYALSGRVIYVNDAHRFYRVEAECNGYTIRESFKF